MIVLPVIGSDASYALSPQKIIAIGLNYRDHIAESPSVLAAERARRMAEPSRVAEPAKRAEPSEPILFAKTPNVLISVLSNPVTER